MVTDGWLVIFLWWWREVMVTMDDCTFWRKRRGCGLSVEWWVVVGMMVMV